MGLAKTRIATGKNGDVVMPRRNNRKTAQQNPKRGPRKPQSKR